MLRIFRRFFGSADEISKILEKLNVSSLVTKLNVQNSNVEIQLKLDQNYRQNRAAILNHITAKFL